MSSITTKCHMNHKDCETRQGTFITYGMFSIIFVYLYKIICKNKLCHDDIRT